MAAYSWSRQSKHHVTILCKLKGLNLLPMLLILATRYNECKFFLLTCHSFNCSGPFFYNPLHFSLFCALLSHISSSFSLFLFSFHLFSLCSYTSYIYQCYRKNLQETVYPGNFLSLKFSLKSQPSVFLVYYIKYTNNKAS